MLRDLQQFLKKYPPEKMPFWPGAVFTTPFGLRTSQIVLNEGGSPGHLGTDRAYGNIETLKMPFPGKVLFTETGGVSGTLTRIISDDLQLELQIFHAEIIGPLKDHYNQGDNLPIMPSNNGFSLGVHSHMETIIPYDETIAEWIREQSLKIDDEHIFRHCKKYNLDSYSLIKKLTQQFLTWEILELWTHFAVRRALPVYRMPLWGSGPTMHIDSRWLLKI